MLGPKIVSFQMGPFLKFMGPVITLVPSTAVGTSLSLSSLNSSFINRPEKGRTAGLLPAPSCRPQTFFEKGQTDLSFCFYH